MPKRAHSVDRRAGEVLERRAQRARVGPGAGRRGDQHAPCRRGRRRAARGAPSPGIQPATATARDGQERAVGAGPQARLAAAGRRPRRARVADQRVHAPEGARGGQRRLLVGGVGRERRGRGARAPRRRRRSPPRRARQGDRAAREQPGRRSAVATASHRAGRLPAATCARGSRWDTRCARPASPPLAAALACAAALPAAAEARSVAVAGGDAAATLTDVTTNRVVARLPVGGAHARRGGLARRHARVVRRGRDGERRRPRGQRRRGARSRSRGIATSIAVSADGARVYAARRGARGRHRHRRRRAVAGTIRLGRRDRGPLAVSADGTRAVVVLDARRVAVVDLVRGRRAAPRPPRRARPASPSARPGAWRACSPCPGGRATAAPGDRRRRPTGTSGLAIRLRRGVGGGVAISADGRLRRRRRGGGQPRDRRSSTCTPAASARAWRTGRGPGLPGHVARTARGSTSPTAARARSRWSASSPSSA